MVGGKRGSGGTAATVNPRDTTLGTVDSKSGPDTRELTEELKQCVLRKDNIMRKIDEVYSKWLTLLSEGNTEENWSDRGRKSTNWMGQDENGIKTRKQVIECGSPPAVGLISGSANKKRSRFTREVSEVKVGKEKLELKETKEKKILVHAAKKRRKKRRESGKKLMWNKRGRREKVGFIPASGGNETLIASPEGTEKQGSSKEPKENVCTYPPPPVSKEANDGEEPGVASTSGEIPHMASLEEEDGWETLSEGAAEINPPSYVECSDVSASSKARGWEWKRYLKVSEDSEGEFDFLEVEEKERAVNEFVDEMGWRAQDVVDGVGGPRDGSDPPSLVQGGRGAMQSRAEPTKAGNGSNTDVVAGARLDNRKYLELELGGKRYRAFTTLGLQRRWWGQK